MNGREIVIDMIDQKVAQLGAVVVRADIRVSELRKVRASIAQLNAVRTFLERRQRLLANDIAKAKNA